MSELSDPDIPADTGTMATWFANAIMAGYDHGWKDAAGRSKTWGDFLHTLGQGSDERTET